MSKHSQFVLLFTMIVFSVHTLNASPVSIFSNYQTFDSLKNENLIDSGDTYLYSDLPKAEAFYTLAMTEAIANPSEVSKATALTRLGIVARHKSDYVEALSYQQNALKIFEKRGDSIEMAAVYHNIAFILRYQKSYDESVEYFEKAIEIRALLKDSMDLGISYNQLGVIYRKQNKLEMAQSSYFKALEIFEAIGDEKNIFRVNGNLASLYHIRKEYKRALNINLKAIPYLKEDGNLSSLVIRYSNIAKAYEKIKNHIKSITYLDSAIAIGEEHEYLEQLARDYRSRSKNYKKIDDFESALKDYKKYKNIQDTIFDVKKTKEITKKLLEYDFQKQRELDSLVYVENKKSLEFKASSERNQKYAILTLLLCMIIVTISLYYIYQNRQRVRDILIENKRLEAEQLNIKLTATNRETERVIVEKSILRKHKDNILQHLKEVIDKKNVNTVFNDLKLLTAHLKNQAVDESIQLIYDINIDDLNVAFEKKLIDLYPALTKSEREICSLIRSKLSTKDIVNLKGSTQDAVHSIRYRIRKKLNLEKGTELQQFLEKIEI